MLLLYFYPLLGVECPPLASLPWRRLSSHSNFYMDGVDISCEPGYKLPGDLFMKEIICMADGNWDYPDHSLTCSGKPISVINLI